MGGEDGGCLSRWLPIGFLAGLWIQESSWKGLFGPCFLSSWPSFFPSFLPCLLLLPVLLSWYLPPGPQQRFLSSHCSTLVSSPDSRPVEVWKCKGHLAWEDSPHLSPSVWRLPLPQSWGNVFVCPVLHPLAGVVICARSVCDLWPLHTAGASGGGWWAPREWGKKTCHGARGCPITWEHAKEPGRLGVEPPPQAVPLEMWMEKVWIQGLSTNIQSLEIIELFFLKDSLNKF